MGMLQMIFAVVALLIVVTGVGTLATAAGSPRNHCPDRCGDVVVPYPWGVGNDCALSFSYKLTCNYSFTPARPFKGSFEVLKITIPLGKIRVLMSISYDCYNSTGKQASALRWDDLQEANPFAFSQEDNVFTAVGCDTLAVIQGQRGQNYTGGCLTVCDSYDKMEDGSCSGIGCCQTSIPKEVKGYETGLISVFNHSRILNFNPCSYTFLVEKSNYTFHRSDLKEMSRDRQFPVIWDWYIGNQSCKIAQRRSDYACVSANSSCFNSQNGPGYICNCSIGYHGNPYLPNGCQDINECEDPKTYPCNGTCINTPGGFQCACPDGTTGDPFTFGCKENESSKRLRRLRSEIIASVAVVSSLLAVALCIWIFSIIQHKKMRDHNAKCFNDNGGLLLKDKFSSINGIEGTFTIFSREEIEKATKNYDPSLVLGRGGEGIVYKGILPNRTVAIKKAHKVDESKIREFVNEVFILSQLEHRNVVKLVGCCLEVEEPMLVYEFIPNGDLLHHIQGGDLSWNVRLKVAAETASALAHLHSKIQVQVIHRDVKSSNILLDYGFTAKVSDFGASVLVPDSKILVTALVKGTMGYLDPEYMQTQNLTDKSDVYSFGVVLVELLSGKEPLASLLDEGERCLAKRFVSCMQASRLDDVLDSRLATDAEVVKQMEEVASLAMRCLNMRGDDRPPMLEVAGELEGIWRSVSHPWASHYDEEEAQSLLGPSPSRDNYSSKNCSGEKIELAAPPEIGR